jgi:ribosomal protein S21
MIREKVKSSKDFHRALKRFKKRVYDSRIMKEVTDRKHYKKKSQKKREQKNIAELSEKIKRESEY